MGTRDVRGPAGISLENTTDADEVERLDCDSVGETCGVVEGRADCEGVERNIGCGELTPLGDCVDGTQSSIDLDLIVLEPSCEKSAAANGSVTPNGLFSADSVDSQIPVEWCQLRNDHQRGVYVVLVHMYFDENSLSTAEQAYPTVTITVGEDVVTRQREY